IRFSRFPVPGTSVLGFQWSVHVENGSAGSVSWTNRALSRATSGGQWSHIDHAAVLSRGRTQRQRLVIQARLVGQDARDKSGTNSQLQFCAGGLGVVPGGERLNGHPHVRRRVVGGFFWLFPHVALPFSALDFVSE